MKAYPAIEPLESRIAPALAVLHPIPDIVPGIGQTGATLDLGNAFDAAGNFRTHVQFTTNYIDPLNPGQPQLIELELFDDKAPVTVANFLRYVKGLAPSDFNDVFFHRSVAGFVLQGGGFATDAPGSHIAVDPEVHNEFNAGDAERSNLVGTVAMAKTGLGPHTGTSEWFFNLGNNAANLDNQNGGFTVFAKVTQGMNVVNAIGALGTRSLASLNGALTNVPVQNYNPDPDSDPATPPPTPTAAQFLTITNAAVIAPTPANAAGISFSVESITDAVTQAATDLVAGTLNGQALQLQYKVGASGVAKVTVKAAKAGETDVFEDFLVTVKPNLVAATTSDPFPGTLVPGDKANITVQLINSGVAPVTGNFDVTFYLSKLGVPDDQGTRVDPGVDTVVGTLANQSVSLASGGRLSLTTEVAIPQSLLTVQGSNYRVIADVKPVAGSSLDELFADDDVAINAPTHQLFNAFGTFNGRTNVPMTYLDADNHAVTVTLTGGGFGQFDPLGNGSLGFVRVSSTTAASVFAVGTENVSTKTSLDAITILAPLGSALLGSVDLKGNFDAPGGIKTVILGNVGDGVATHTFSIGPFVADATQKASVTLGKVRDIAFTSQMPVAAVNAVEWLDTNASHELITAPAIDSVFITGDATHSGVFQAGFTITGPTKLQSFRLGYLDAANQPITLTITGGGYGQFDGGTLSVNDTTATSVLSLAGTNASVRTDLDKIDILTPLGTAALGNVNLKGDFEAHAGIQSLTLGNVGDGITTHTITIGAFAANPSQKATLALGKVRDVSLTSAMPIAAVNAVEWLDTNASHELITAPAIDSVLITGDATHSGVFQAGFSITGPAKLQSFRLAYLDAANQPITLTITGGGYGQFDAGMVEVKDSTATSALSLAGASASVQTQLNKLSIAAPLGTAALGNLTLKGDFEALGGIKSLTLGNVGDGIATHTFSIGAFAADPAQKATLTLGQVRDVALTSAMPFASLSAVDWLDSNASNELISLTAIDSFLIRGDTTHTGVFQADLTVSGTTKLLAFTVTGTMNDSRVKIAGDVGTVKLGSLVRSDFLVGVTSVPRTLADFGLIKHKIDKFKILNSGAGIPALNDSRIAAAKFGSISVGKIKGASGTADFGFIADRIASYQVGAVTKSGLDAPRKFDRHGHYVTRIV